MIGRPGSEVHAESDELSQWKKQTILELGELVNVSLLRTKDGQVVRLAQTTRKLNGEEAVLVASFQPIEVAERGMVGARSGESREQAVALMGAMHQRGTELSAELDPWLSTKEAAIYTGRSESTIGKAARNGSLKSGGSKGKRAFRRSALDAWLAGGVVLVLALLACLGAVAGACLLGARPACGVLDRLCRVTPKVVPFRMESRVPAGANPALGGIAGRVRLAGLPPASRESRRDAS